MSGGRSPMYCVLRYVPDLVKDEPVNLGVILCLPGMSRPVYKLPASARELARGDEVGQETLRLVDEVLSELNDHDLGLLNADNPGDVWSYIASCFGSHMRLTPPRTWAALQPDDALNSLYQMFVTAKPTADKANHTRSTREVKQTLRNTFRLAGIHNRLREVRFPGVRTQVPVAATWAWLNGTLNFADAISLETGDYPQKETQVRAMVQRAEDLSANPDQHCTVFVAYPREAGSGSDLLRLLQNTCRVMDVNSGKDVAEYAGWVQREGKDLNQWPSEFRSMQ